MNDYSLSGFTVIIILLALLFVFGCVFFYVKLSNTMKRLDTMLTKAMSGEFEESEYSEKQISRLESRMAEFLKCSYLSSSNIEEEHKKIQSLIADISHQTKTPISNIMLYSELLAEKSLPNDCEELIEQVIKQSEKLDFLIRALVKTSRLESGIIKIDATLQNIVPLLHNVVEEIRPKADKKNICLNFEVEESLYAYFDAKWTEEAIYNIVDNAVKYTKEGGGVSIRAMVTEMFLRIDIKDTGIGISEEEQAKIFTRFYRSPFVSEYEGVGIGLYLARKIILAESGYMKVYSEPLKGSVFSVFLKK